MNTLGPSRRRRSPVPRGLMALLVVGLGLVIGWSWYAVFSPLFEDPREWAARDRVYRKMVREVLAADPEGAAPTSNLPVWP
ncbi:MAG: hypothetical protein VX938_07575, partial [Myxococcota bacterium]|nr:hypothetical protein [Myxococcota bacterium]